MSRRFFQHEVELSWAVLELMLNGGWPWPAVPHGFRGIWFKVVQRQYGKTGKSIFENIRSSKSSGEGLPHGHV
jgi:hypothetical protein